MDRSSILRASTNSYKQVEKCLYLLFYYLQIPRRTELCAGRGRKEGTVATRGETCIPNGSPGGKCDPESSRRVGHAFPMAAQAETASRNPHSEWDAFSGWAVGGKLIPESRLKLGRAFRSISSTPKPMRPPFQNWVEESQNAIAGGQYDCRR